MMIKQHWYILAIALWTIFVLPLLITTSYVSGQDDNVDLAGQERLRNIDIIFSIDSSGSMAPPPPEVPNDEHSEFNRDPDNLRIKGVQQFMKQLTPAYHWVGLVSWDSDIDLSVNLTNKYNVVQSALEKIDGEGGTDLEMGLREALKLLAAAPRKQSNKMVLLLTDGEGSVRDDVVNMAKELMVTVYTVGLSVTPQAESILTRIADETG
ncbi:MAG: VWA domain-containing protein, partial [Candidatus Brocadiaceae bacterium]|nr:VWA domain-containing protein [Candidatus Brocadiaceae bacterium]